LTQAFIGFFDCNTREPQEIAKISSRIERTISSMYIPPAGTNSKPRVRQFAWVCRRLRNVEADKAQAGQWMLPNSLQQRPCFALAGGGIIETGAYLDEFFLVCGGSERGSPLSLLRHHIVHIDLNSRRLLNQTDPNH